MGQVVTIQTSFPFSTLPQVPGGKRLSQMINKRRGEAVGPGTRWEGTPPSRA